MTKEDFSKFELELLFLIQQYFGKDDVISIFVRDVETEKMHIGGNDCLLCLKDRIQDLEDAGMVKHISEDVEEVKH